MFQSQRHRRTRLRAFLDDIEILAVIVDSLRSFGFVASCIVLDVRAARIKPIVDINMMNGYSASKLPPALREVAEGVIEQRMSGRYDLNPPIRQIRSLRASNHLLTSSQV